MWYITHPVLLHVPLENVIASKEKKKKRSTPKLYHNSSNTSLINFKIFPKLLKKLSKPERKRSPPITWFQKYSLRREVIPALCEGTKSFSLLISISHKSCLGGSPVTEGYPQPMCSSTRASFYLFQTERSWSCCQTPDRTQEFLKTTISTTQLYAFWGISQPHCAKWGYFTRYKWKPMLIFMESIRYQWSASAPTVRIPREASFRLLSTWQQL